MLLGTLTPPTVSKLKVVFPGAKELNAHESTLEEDVVVATKTTPILHSNRPLKNPTPVTSIRELDAGMLSGLTTVTMGIAATVND
jgi:hypothetical protein